VTSEFTGDGAPSGGTGFGTRTRVTSGGNLPPSEVIMSSAPSEAWRFLQGARPCGARSNQPLLPSVAPVEEVQTEQARGSVHRAPRRPQERPHSPKLETAPLSRLMQTAMVLTRQKPTQRKRLGELPEGLSGSTKSVVCVERRVKNVGGPDGSGGGSRREGPSQGGPRTVRASDPLIVLRDGSADHTGKGWTELRSLPRKHCPNMKDRTHNANLPAGYSTEG
jgi:hypothetical protein